MSASTGRDWKEKYVSVLFYLCLHAPWNNVKGPTIPWPVERASCYDFPSV